MMKTNFTSYLLFIYILFIVFIANFFQIGPIRFFIEFGFLAFLLMCLFMANGGIRSNKIASSYMIVFIAITALGGAFSGVSPEVFIYMIQMLTVFLLFFVLIQTAGNHTSYRRTLQVYILSAFALAATMLVVFQSGNQEYFIYQRLAAVSQNANATGYFFTTIIILTLFHEDIFPRLFRPVLILPMIFCVIYSGSFGAILALILGISSYLALKSALLFSLASAFMVIAILIFDINIVLDFMIDSEMRSLSRVGSAVKIYINSGFNLEAIGSASERAVLMNITWEEITSSWHLNIMSGVGMEVYPNPIYSGYVHNALMRVWYGNGLLSAIIYAIPFHICLVWLYSRKLFYWFSACLVILVFWHTTPLLYQREVVFPMVYALAMLLSGTRIAQRPLSRRRNQQLIQRRRQFSHQA